MTGPAFTINTSEPWSKAVLAVSRVNIRPVLRPRPNQAGFPAKTLRNIRSAWIKEQHVRCDNGKITQYQVNMMVTFVLDD